MARRPAGSILTVAMLCVFAGTGFAQTSDDLELNLFVAGSAYTRNSYEIGAPNSSTPIQARFRLDRAIRGGLRFNVFNSGHWGQEFFYSYEPNKAHFRGENSPSLRRDLSIQIHNLGVTGLYYFNADEAAPTRPFASFGLGATIYRPTTGTRAYTQDPNRGNLPGFGQSNEFALNYGLGVKQHLGSRFGLRADIRGYLGRHPSFNLPGSSGGPDAVVLPAGGAIHNLEVSGGINFYLGR